jgi:sulfite reductase alpha subunit-like flavoprotein
MDNIMQALLLTYPLPDNVEIIPAAAIPAARVTMVEDPSFIPSSSPPLNPGFYSATVKCNNRITAGDWYQDVRHFEFDFDDDIRHVIARIHLPPFS